MKKRIKQMLGGILVTVTIIGSINISVLAEANTENIDSNDEVVVHQDEADVDIWEEYNGDDPQYYQEMIKYQESEIMQASLTGQSYAHNAKFNGYDVRDGIDVSRYQGDIDWSAVKASGIDFVFIRVGYRGYGGGIMQEDSKYWQNISGAINAGLNVGVYVFSQAISEAEAREEARYAIDRVRNYTGITLPIVMDYEFASDAGGATGRLLDAHLSADTATAICNAFSDEVTRSGYVPMIYANKNYLESNLYASNLTASVWLANYTTQTSYAGDYTFWQYSSNGYVNGISGRVDSNFWYVSPAQISNGTYTIRTALNTSLTVDVDAAGRNNCTNVQLWQINNCAAQDWVFQYVGDGKYTIMSSCSGKYLDVAGGGNSAGTNVQQYEYNGCDTQKWCLKDVGNGYYNIISAWNGLYLDVSGGNASNGTNIQLWTNNGMTPQKFLLQKTTYSQTVPDGVYSIAMEDNRQQRLDISGRSMTAGANVQLWTKNNLVQQEYVVKYVGNGQYTIMSSCSGKMLDVAGAGRANGTNVQQWDDNGNLAQRWYIKATGTGSYFIVSACNGLCLDVAGANLSQGTNVWTWQMLGNSGQRFMFNTVGSGRVLSDGVYRIAVKQNKKLVLDVSGMSSDDGANVQLWSKNGCAAQEFRITYKGDGVYTICSEGSGKMLDVSGGCTATGTNIQQWNNNNLSPQEWYVKDAGNGSYYLISKCNGLYVDIAGCNINCGTNIWCWYGLASDGQKFVFERVDNGRTINDGYYTIASALNENLMVDVSGGNAGNGTNIQLWTKNGMDPQKFYVHYLGSGTYEINTFSGKRLDVAGAGTEAGTNVIQWESNNGNQQKWYIRSTGDGYYSIISVHNGLYLDINGNNGFAGNNVQVWTGNGLACQKYKFNR